MVVTKQPGPKESIVSNEKEYPGLKESIVSKELAPSCSRLDPLPNDTQVFKFKNPADECAPEDCCCCFYFLYLLFDNDNKPSVYEVSPKKLLKEGTTKTGPGYSYYSNMSTGSSIDSKNSWSVYPPSRDDNDHDCDKVLSLEDEDADGWKATNVPPSDSQDMINLHDYNHQEGPSNDAPLDTFCNDGGD